MNTRSVILACILSLFIGQPASAEFYKYVDETGQTRWTDDLSKIPKNQRAAAQRIQSIEDEKKEDPTDAAQQKKAASLSTGEIRDDAIKSPEKVDDGYRATLEKEKKELDALFRQLQKERNELEQLEKEATDFQARARLNNEISEYNKKTDGYKKRLNEYNQKVQVYNQSILNKKSP